jgi:hypothetical protein
MLIVADGDDVRDLAEGHERVRLIHLAESRQIGAKRNFGCGRAAGEIICHFDDDDWSEPERVEAQVAVLEAKPLIHVTGYHTMRFTDGNGNWWEYAGMSNYALGTSLCYRRRWWQANPFRAVQIGEDNDFVGRAWALSALHAEAAKRMMHATIHRDNTSPRSLGAAWTRV